MTTDPSADRDRLGSIQASTDAFTTALLDERGLAADWECLELGAGAGSIARWLADRCPDGRVVAVDVDTRHVEPAPGLEVVRADITADDFAPGRFDLVHARFVFCHLAARDTLLRRAARWLKPGGWLVVTDPYQLPPETSPFPVARRLLDAYQDAQARRGTDLMWARSLPSLLARAGLAEIGFTGRLACMGNLGQDRWRPLIDHAAPDLLAGGDVTAGDLDAFHEHLDDPGFIDIPQVLVAAWGRNA